MEKPGRKKARDPALRKARDNARQRKICANSSDKAARRNAPLKKAMGNRKIRRKNQEALKRSGEDFVDTLRLRELDFRLRPWGSENAAAWRAERDAERAYLDATAGTGPQGRRRAQSFRIARFHDKTYR